MKSKTTINITKNWKRMNENSPLLRDLLRSKKRLLFIFHSDSGERRISTYTCVWNKSKKHYCLSHSSRKGRRRRRRFLHPSIIGYIKIQIKTVLVVPRLKKFNYYCQINRWRNIWRFRCKDVVFLSGSMITHPFLLVQS